MLKATCQVCPPEQSNSQSYLVPVPFIRVFISGIQSSPFFFHSSNLTSLSDSLGFLVFIRQSLFQVSGAFRRFFIISKSSFSPQSSDTLYLIPLSGSFLSRLVRVIHCNSTAVQQHSTTVLLYCCTAALYSTAAVIQYLHREKVATTVVRVNPRTYRYPGSIKSSFCCRIALCKDCSCVLAAVAPFLCFDEARRRGWKRLEVIRPGRLSVEYGRERETEISKRRDIEARDGKRENRSQ